PSRHEVPGNRDARDTRCLGDQCLFRKARHQESQLPGHHKSRTAQAVDADPFPRTWRNPRGFGEPPNYRRSEKPPKQNAWVTISTEIELSRDRVGFRELPMKGAGAGPGRRVAILWPQINRLRQAHRGPACLEG